VATTLTLNPGGDYSQLLWYLGGEPIGTGDSLNISIEDEGNYTVDLLFLNEFGCSDSLHAETTIDVYPNPDADFNLTPELLSPLSDVIQVQNQSSGADIYEWNFSDLGTSSSLNPSFTLPSDSARRFDICLRVATDFGCADSICRSIEMTQEVAFYAPNAITADNDGINDGFLPVMLGFELESYNLKIFNRWGDLIFETNDPTKPWLADVHGGAYYANEDVYQWLITMKENSFADYKTYKGFVTVLR
jgi:hypothetical protein